MPFVKLDTRILDSTLWVERLQREVFITALLLAQPREIQDMPQLSVRTLDETGFVVPAGWYGFVEAAGVGILRRALVEIEGGMKALEELGEEDPESRSSDFGGRRLVRVDGGYVVLNYMAYRDKDHTATERQRRLRQRRKEGVTALQSRVTPLRNVTSRFVTQADADADADAVKTKPPLRDLGISPEMISQAVLTELCLSGRDLRVVLDEVCKAELLKGVSADSLRADMIAAWREYEPAKPKLVYFKGAAKFFGEGDWRNKAGWPWKEGVTPVSKRRFTDSQTGELL